MVCIRCRHNISSGLYICDSCGFDTRLSDEDKEKYLSAIAGLKARSNATHVVPAPVQDENIRRSGMSSRTALMVAVISLTLLFVLCSLLCPVLSSFGSIRSSYSGGAVASVGGNSSPSPTPSPSMGVSLPSISDDEAMAIKYENSDTGFYPVIRFDGFEILTPQYIMSPQPDAYNFYVCSVAVYDNNNVIPSRRAYFHFQYSNGAWSIVSVGDNCWMNEEYPNRNSL